jgi:glutaredoxin-related protein
MNIYPNWPLHSSVSNHNSVHILQFHQACYMFGPSNPRDHYDSVSWKGTSCDAPAASSPCYLAFHWSKLLPKYFVHVHPLCFLPQYERPVFTHLSFALTVYNHCHFCSTLQNLHSLCSETKLRILNLKWDIFVFLGHISQAPAPGFSVTVIKIYFYCRSLRLKIRKRVCRIFDNNRINSHYCDELSSWEVFTRNYTSGTL